MGTKKKSKGKKGDAKKRENVDPPTEWDDLPLQELETVVASLTSDLEKATRDRARVQAEHDAVQSYYNVTQEQIRDAQLRIDEVDRRAESRAEDNAVELRVYAHKVKHINYEHERRLEEVREERARVLEEEKRRQEERREGLEARREEARRDWNEGEAASAAKIERAKADLARELEFAREGLERDLDAFRARCDARLEEMKSDLELTARVELREAEERADLHLSDLERRHKEAFEDARAYFNSAARTGLEEIQKLQGDIDRMREAEERALLQMEKLKNESDRLSGPLKETSSKVAKLRRDVRDKEKDKMSLRNTRARLAVAKDRINKLTEDYEKLRANYEEVEKERDTLKKQWEANGGKSFPSGDESENKSV